MAESRWALLRPYLTHPTIFVLGGAALAIAVVFHATLFSWRGAVACLVGILLFIPQEYVTHRFVLHAPAAKSRFFQRVQERLHYGHHKDPNDLSLLFGPLWGVLPSAVLYWLVYLAVTRDVALASCVSFSTILAYLYYEHAHYVAHSRIVPATEFGRRMKRMHLWHHHKNEFYWFGVTQAIMDRLVGTHPDVQDVPASGTTRDLRALEGVSK